MLTNKEQIEIWLTQMNICEYVIHDDLVVDVPKYVNLWGRGLTEIPIQFGVVDGNFDCGNNKLTSLKGVPYRVNGNFECGKNKLTSLHYAPSHVSYNFYCLDNSLVDFCYSQLHFEGEFLCHHSEHQKISFFDAYYENEDCLRLHYDKLQKFLEKQKFKDLLVSSLPSQLEQKQRKL